jgi:hypothetical protein
MAQQLERRPLRFANLDEVLQDVERLSTQGYRQVGNWSLAQICAHLTDWMRFPLEGFPKSPLPVRMIMGVARRTIGPRIMKKSIATGSMRAGLPTAPQTVAPATEDQAAAIDNLRRAVARFQAHTGEFLPSPLFGPTDREQTLQLQLVHCAHHLSFLLPNEEQTGE